MEDNQETKKVLGEEYQKQKQKVNDMMDAAEAEEIKKIIDKEGKEGLNFWKTMKRIKKKVEATTKIRTEQGEITEDIDEILEEKKKYFCKLYSKSQQTQPQPQQSPQQSHHHYKTLRKRPKLFKKTPSFAYSSMTSLSSSTSKKQVHKGELGFISIYLLLITYQPN